MGLFHVQDESLTRPWQKPNALRFGTVPTALAMGRCTLIAPSVKGEGCLWVSFNTSIWRLVPCDHSLNLFVCFWHYTPKRRGIMRARFVLTGQITLLSSVFLSLFPVVFWKAAGPREDRYHSLTSLTPWRIESGCCIVMTEMLSPLRLQDLSNSARMFLWSKMECF